MEENRVQATEQQMMLSCLQTMAANQKKSQQRQQIQLVCMVVVACAMVGMLVGVLLLSNRIVARLETTLDNMDAAVGAVGTSMENVNTLAKKLNDVDFETLTENVNSLTGGEAGGLGEVLEDMKTAMADVQKALENVSKLDIDSLNKSITQMGTVMEGIQNWYDNLPAILKGR